MRGDPTIYLAHALFWAAFIIARLVSRSRPDTAAARGQPVTTDAQAARGTKTLLFFHTGAFGVLYWAIARAVFSGDMPHRLPGQQWIGSLFIALGAFLAVWSLANFRSWRLEAKIDAGHQLASGGPFAIVRHPIYAALNLLALGTACWIPSGAMWLGVVLVAIGGDLRARAEEKLLTAAFGEKYRVYAARTQRFVPGLY